MLQTPVPLNQLGHGESALVEGLSEVSGIDPIQGAALLARLRDLGFVAGARCQVVARMWLGGDPLVVRIGGSTFALRRAEAQAVRVIRASERVLPQPQATRESRVAAA